MEEEIKSILDKNLESLHMIVSLVKLERENENLFLRIELDSEEVLDIDHIVLATKIIDPIIEEMDPIKEKYILEVYGKSKGSDENEC